MKRVLIVGAGGFGREILSWARHVEPLDSKYKIGGFLDANPAALAGFELGTSVLGDPATFQPEKNDVFVCAIGDPATRHRVVSGLASRGAHFVSLIHDSVIMGRDCRFGEGCVFCPGVILTTNITMGKFVSLNLGATAGHDVTVGDFCNLNVHVDLAGHSSLGNLVFAGSHAFILPGVHIGDRAVVGAGAVVTRNVAAGSTVFGVPARRIVTRPEIKNESRHRSHRVSSAAALSD